MATADGSQSQIRVFRNHYPTQKSPVHVNRKMAFPPVIFPGIAAVHRRPRQVSTFKASPNYWYALTYDVVAGLGQYKANYMPHLRARALGCPVCEWNND